MYLTLVSATRQKRTIRQTMIVLSGFRARVCRCLPDMSGVRVPCSRLRAGLALAGVSPCARERRAPATPGRRILCELHQSTFLS